MSRLIWQHWHWPRLRLMLLGMGLAVWLVSAWAIVPVDRLAAPSTAIAQTLPAAQSHPLPPTLAQVDDRPSSGDYFAQIQAVEVGYLIWSRFPITVYVEPLNATEAANSFLQQRSQTWITAILQAVKEWNSYLPLQIVSHPEGADITVLRSPPPLRVDRESGQLSLRARAAETHFEIYPQRTATQTLLAQRFTIRLRPDQAPLYTLATARHELGHALGIWGHSLQETDALYFSQVRQPLPISARDVATLKRIYAQPTRLGWPLPDSASN